MGFTRVSEETSETVFLLVENYQIDHSSRSSLISWEFLKKLSCPELLGRKPSSVTGARGDHRLDCPTDVL